MFMQGTYEGLTKINKELRGGGWGEEGGRKSKSQIRKSTHRDKRFCQFVLNSSTFIANITFLMAV